MKNWMKPTGMLVVAGLIGLAAPAEAQVGSGVGNPPPAGGAIAQDLVLGYESEGGFFPTRRELRVLEDGTALLVEGRNGQSREATGRLEPQEVAGLSDLMDEIFDRGGSVAHDPGTGADGLDRALFRWTDGAKEERSGNTQDLQTRFMVAWLDEIAEALKRGDLDDENKYIEAKLARPDIGGHAASGFTVTRAKKEEIRWELDARGHRVVTRRARLQAGEMQAVFAFIALVDPEDHKYDLKAGSTAGSADADAMAALYVIRVGAKDDPTRMVELHPLVDSDPLIPAEAIFVYLLIP